ncbi:MAG: hypothetical protein V7603_1872 [Micromonosporaceae bacterium]
MKQPEFFFQPQQRRPHPVAAAPDGQPVVYRTDTLVAPADTVTDPQVLAELDAILAPGDWRLRPGPAQDSETVLEIVGRPPDARQALANLRDAAGVSAPTAAAIAALDLRRQYFVGMPLPGKTGAPAKDGHAGAERAARAVIGPPPARHAAAAVPGGRRPVVALLDTGVGTHPWLAGAGDDPFWVDAQALGWDPSTAGDLPPDEDIGDITPADGTLDTHAGHGTFLAGLIRQLAPDARVLSLHAMYGDGSLDPKVVLHALTWLRDRVGGAAADPERFVDVLCLAFGYYERGARDERHTADLFQVLGDLGNLGVRVVMSAGNQASDLPCFPAALAGNAEGPRTRLASVGAVNPDGSFAEYSNFGTWVKEQAVGTAVVSTTPRFGRPQDGTHEYNPNNLVSGFANWGGTSFAAGVFAGCVAAALSAGAAGTELRDVSGDAPHQRAAGAFEVARRRAVAPWAVAGHAG